MTSISRRRLGALSVATTVGLALTACGGTTESGQGAVAGGSGSDAGGAGEGTVEVEDNNGTHTVEVPPKSVVATDNRTFETLCEWDVELAAAPKPLLPETVECWQGDDLSLIHI